MHNNEPSLHNTLNAIQLRLSVHEGKRLTQSRLAELAGVGKRSLGEWMRGATAPPGTIVLLRLLSMLSDEELVEVISEWRQPSKSKTSSGD